MSTPVYGEFNNVNDTMILQLSPIVNILTGFNAYTDNINFTGGWTFTKQFQYSIDNAHFSGWITLTNANLQAVSVTLGDTYYVNIKYICTAIGTGKAEWDFFELQAAVKLVWIMRINKSKYDTIFGPQRFLDIQARLSTFNNDIIKDGVQVYTVIDTTIADLQLYFNSQDNTYDFNTLYKSDVGGKLLNVFKQLSLDNYAGFESQN